MREGGVHAPGAGPTWASLGMSVGQCRLWLGRKAGGVKGPAGQVARRESASYLWLTCCHFLLFLFPSPPCLIFLFPTDPLCAYFFLLAQTDQRVKAARKVWEEARGRNLSRPGDLLKHCETVPGDIIAAHSRGLSPRLQAAHDSANVSTVSLALNFFFLLTGPSFSVT